MNLVDDYLRVAARKATNGKTLTLYLGKPGRVFSTWLSTSSEGSSHGHALHVLTTLVCWEHPECPKGEPLRVGRNYSADVSAEHANDALGHLLPRLATGTGTRQKSTFKKTKRGPELDRQVRHLASHLIRKFGLRREALQPARGSAVGKFSVAEGSK